MFFQILYWTLTTVLQILKELAIALNNFMGTNDVTLMLNNLCFIQYNIGNKDEHEPNN